MNNDEKKPAPKAERPPESFEEFCRRLGIKLVRGEKGGMEFVPWHGPQQAAKEFEERDRNS